MYMRCVQTVLANMTEYFSLSNKLNIQGQLKRNFHFIR